MKPSAASQGALGYCHVLIKEEYKHSDFLAIDDDLAEVIAVDHHVDGLVDVLKTRDLPERARTFARVVDAVGQKGCERIGDKR